MVENQEIENEETIDEPIKETVSKDEAENIVTEDSSNAPQTVDKEKYDELYDKYLRVLAEYDNFKKRTQKEKEELYGTAKADTIEKLLPVVDNLERAISALSETESSEFSEGVKMVTKQFFEILEKMGVTAIDALGSQFDPNLHNAVMHVDDEEYDTNVVIEQFMKGYQMKDKVIRHSMVKVAN